MNPTIVAIALALWIATGLGSWFYRGHIDEGEVKAAQDAIAATTARVAEASQKAAADATKAAQDDADKRATTFQQQIDNQRNSYEQKLLAARIALRRMPSCPVPLDAIGVLLDTAKSTSSSSPAPNPRPGPGSSNSGTVEASVVIANCEYNRGAFDRVSSRLAACIASYDAARAEINAK